jgi:hypothetical protein
MPNKHPYQTASFPVELLSLSEQMVGSAARISEFGPVLFSLLNLNDTQAGVILYIILK